MADMQELVRTHKWLRTGVLTLSCALERMAAHDLRPCDVFVCVRVCLREVLRVARCAYRVRASCAAATSGLPTTSFDARAHTLRTIPYRTHVKRELIL